MAARTASRVSARTAGWSLSTRETVCLVTPASFAASSSTGRAAAKLRLLPPLVPRTNGPSARWTHWLGRAAGEAGLRSAAAEAQHPGGDAFGVAQFGGARRGGDGEVDGRVGGEGQDPHGEGCAGREAVECDVPRASGEE